MSWPKKRTLLIGARDFGDFLQASRIVKNYEETVKRYDQKPGRHNFIGHTIQREIPGGHGATEIKGSIAVWYTTNQLTIYFNHED